MAKELNASRRDFLKLSATSAGAVAIASSGIDAVVSSSSSSAWSAPKQINPGINNLRVVFVKDKGMVKTNCSQFSNFGNMQNQNNYVDGNLIKSNLDKLAITLTQKNDKVTAWKTIFMKPDAKQWNQVTVAIKTNAIGVNHPRVAVIGKICEELIALGVDASKIVIYDASRTCTTLYNSFVGEGKGIPANVKISDGGSKYNVTLANGTTKETCTDVLVNQSGVFTKDILVNIAVCKNHSNSHGNFTMTMKNHIGSLRLTCPSVGSSLSLINRSEAILGNFNTPGVPPRQQLCIIDALWSSSDGGPGATPDVDTYSLFMGTSSPIIDYLVATKIRVPIVQDTVNKTFIESWITDYGHKLTEVQNLDMIDAMDYISPINPVVMGWNGQPISVTVTLAGSFYKTSSVKFSLPGINFISSLTVYDIRGRMVRNLSASARGKAHREILWDGKDETGSLLSSGNYIINCISGSYQKSHTISLIK